MVKVQAKQPGMLQAIDDALPQNDCCIGPIEASIYIKEQVGEFFQFVCTCMCCLFCTGPCLILIGVFMFLSIFDDQRAGKIEEYNKVVAAWTDTHRGAWQAAAPAAMTSSATGVETEVKFTPSTDDTKTATIEKNDAIKTYEALYYTGDLVPRSFVAEQVPAEVPLPVFFTISATDITVDLLPFEEETIKRSNRTDTYRYARLSSICLKLQPDGASWQVSKDGEGQGCFAQAAAKEIDKAAADALRSGAVYTADSRCKKDETDPVATCGQDLATYWAGHKIEFELRHKEDPMLYANKEGLCGRSGKPCDFGTSKTQKFFQAVILWAIGGFFCLCVYGPVYGAINYMKSSSPRQQKQIRKNEKHAAMGV